MSQSSLRFGADLATVFCASEAAVPIKCYSPDLIVSPIYNSDTVRRYDSIPIEDGVSRHKIALEAAQSVLDQLPRLHSVVIGPGMGRSDFLGAVMEVIIRHARLRQLP